VSKRYSAILHLNSLVRPSPYRRPVAIKNNLIDFASGPFGLNISNS
jgi:hypothetical protein